MEEVNKKKHFKLQWLKVIKTLTVVKAIYEKYNEQWVIIDNVKKINNAGLKITRRSKKYLQKISYNRGLRYKRKIAL